MAANIGQFAGSFFEAFSKTKISHEENKRRTDIAKMQAKLVEAQLQAGQIKLDANTKLADIFTGSVGEIKTVGEAVPAQDGRKAVPEFEFTGKDKPASVAEALQDPEAFLALMQSGNSPLIASLAGSQQPTGFQKDLGAAGIFPGSPKYEELLDAIHILNRVNE